MPLTFNITNGVGVGKAAKVPVGLYVVAAAFLVYFLRWALFDAKF